MNDERIPVKILRELRDSDIILRAKMAEIADEERRNVPDITDKVLADRIAQKCLFRDCDSWISARREIRAAGLSLGLDE
jgi:hypothetical protein